LRTKNADLSFRVFDKTGLELTIRDIDALNQTLGPDQIFFNVPKRDGVCTPSLTFVMPWNDRKGVRYSIQEKHYGRDEYPVWHRTLV
jgi:hypothetical protein